MLFKNQTCDSWVCIELCVYRVKPLDGWKLSSLCAVNTYYHLMYSSKSPFNTLMWPREAHDLRPQKPQGKLQISLPLSFPVCTFSAESLGVKFLMMCVYILWLSIHTPNIKQPPFHGPYTLIASSKNTLWDFLVSRLGTHLWPCFEVSQTTEDNRNLATFTWW